MNTFENLYSRKSIRCFNGDPITDEQLNEILKAAYAAPVGHAKYDSLALTVIRNKDYLARWEAHMAAVVGQPGLHPFYGAPTVILVSSLIPDSSLKMCNVNFSNAAGVVQNMALAATELGVGACHIWGAVRALDSALIEEMNLPEGMVPCCALALGQMDEVYTLREIPENRIKTAYMD